MRGKDLNSRFTVFLISLLVFVSCKPRFNPEITSEDLKETVSYLASDSLKGRKAGEAGDKLAAQFILDEFKKAGLELMYNDGFQTFGLVTSAELGSNNALTINNKSFRIEEDFLPYAFSSNTEVEAPVVFAGYGIDVEMDTLVWNDYQTDVSGKWVLILKGDPDMENPNSPLVPFSDARAKALTASDKNAAGVILIAGPEYSENDELSSLVFDKNSSRYSIPVIQVTRAVANKMLENTNQSIESLETEILDSNKTKFVDTKAVVRVNVDVKLSETESQNVVALIPGKDEKFKDEYIVIGAHYDHLGMGGSGSGSRTLDTVAVHNGADDNASGVAAVIELAEKMAGEGDNKRSVIFAAFGAEEMGLIGSKTLVAGPPVETDKMVAMFNFDMVGRLDTTTNSISIGGSQTSVEAEEIMNRLNPGFELAFSPEGVGPSDHASFYLQDIPVFFISTGAHADYHTPYDDEEFINYEGMKKLTEFSYDILRELANQEQSLTFQEAGPKYQRSRGSRFKVTLGVMPDFAGIEKRGMRIDAVSTGKPADKGGMKKGDIIVAIDGKKVGNIYDYMNRLQQLEAGQTISVDVIRDEKIEVLIVQL